MQRKIVFFFYFREEVQNLRLVFLVVASQGGCPPAPNRSENRTDQSPLIYFGSHDSAIKMQAFIAFAARKFGSYENNPYLCSRILSIGYMEPKIGDRMKVSPQLTDQADWIDGEVIDVEHNPFMGLVISIKDKLGRIFFGQSRFFVAL